MLFGPLYCRNQNIISYPWNALIGSSIDTNFTIRVSIGWCILTVRLVCILYVDFISLYIFIAFLCMFLEFV